MGLFWSFFLVSNKRVKIVSAFELFCVRCFTRNLQVFQQYWLHTFMDHHTFCQNLSPSSPLHNMHWTKIVLDTGFVHMRQDYESLPWSASHAYSNVWLERWRRVLVAPRFENQSLSSTCPTVLKRTPNSADHHHYSSSSSSCLSASCLWFFSLLFSIFNIFI